MQSPEQHLTPEQIDGLLQTSQRALAAENADGARALARLLTRQAPHDRRTWLLLSELAETEEERQHAQQHAAVLAVPHNPATPHRQRQQPASSASLSIGSLLHSASLRWIFIVGSGLLLVLLLWSLRTEETTQAPADTRQAGNPPTPMAPGEAPPLPTVAGVAARQPDEPTHTPVNVATPFALPMTIGFGSVLEENNWHATLISSTYITILEGSLGSIQSEGQLVLVVVAVGNTESSARRLPPDFFVLLDDQGRSYRAITGASSIYLANYGRGQRGDLALEDMIPPGGGMFSLPLIFDVPQDATGLILTMTRNPDGGWPVLETVPTPQPAGDGLPVPTPTPTP
jgi:hypothetical protein